MSILRILLLGTPTVYFGDQLVRIRRRIQRALLCYLAAQEDMAGREKLSELFWPEEDGEVARRHLREALSKLRADLPDPEALITDGDRVGLDPDRVWVDMREFIRVLKQVERTPWQIPSSTPLPSAVYQALVRAVRLWRGPLFMAGAALPPKPELEDWWARTGQDLQNARARILERLADHASVSGDPEGALNWLHAALEDDPFNETLHARVLELLVALGRRSEALQYYNTIEELLYRELNTTPSSTVQNIYQKIATDAPPHAQTGRNGWPVAWGMQVPFVGRANALSALKQAYYSGGLAVISGEAGAGKSRLVQELYYLLAPAPRLLLAPARPQESTLPFQPLIEMIREAVRPDEWAGLAPTWANSLAVLLPELLFSRSDLAPARAAAPDQARALLFESIHQLLLLMSKDLPVLLFLDDAQWADEASLAALGYLAERAFFSEHGLLIIAARVEEKNANLDGLLTSLHGAPPIVEISLEQLSLEEVTDLARYSLGQEPTPEFIHQLAHDTGGNPLFVLETLRAVLEHALPPDMQHLPESLPLANSIHTLVRARLRQLSQPAMQILVTTAVVGNQFDVEVVEKASGMQPEQVVQTLEELERARLIRPLPVPQPASGGTGYHFIHDKIREVVLMDLSPARRRLIHHRVAQALEETLGARAGQQAAVLAQHFEAGGDLPAAFRYWTLAGQHARQLFSIQEAYSCYRRAENLLTALNNPPTEDQLYQLYGGWGEIAEENGDLETLNRVYTILRRMGEQLNSPLLTGTALSGLGSAALIAYHTLEGLRYIEQATPALESSGNLYEKLQANIRRGLALMTMSRYGEAISAYEKALALGEGSSHPGIRQACTDAHTQLALVWMRSGWPVRAREHAETALRQSIWPPQSASQIRIYHALAITHHETGLFRPAKTFSHQGIEVAEQTRSWYAAGHLHVAAARSDFLSGELDECSAHLDTAFALSERAGGAGILPDALCVQGDVYWYLEAYPQAAETYQAGVQTGQDHFSGMDNLHRLGMIYGFSGEPRRGLELIDQALDYARSTGADKIRLAAGLSRGLVLREEGAFEQANETLRLVEVEAGERQLAPTQIVARASIAYGMLLRGQADAALAAAEGLIEHLQDVDSPWLELWSQRVAHGAARAKGGAGRRHMERIQVLLNQMGERTTREPLHTAFEQFRQKVLAGFQPAE